MFHVKKSKVGRIEIHFRWLLQVRVPYYTRGVDRKHKYVVLSLRQRWPIIADWESIWNYLSRCCGGGGC